MLTSKVPALIFGTLTIITSLTILPACEAEAECNFDIAYECPEGEEECKGPDELGCKEYTFEEGECSQTIICAEIDEPR